MNFKPIETDENVLVMPGAVVCGDVTVGEGTAFWFNSVCRAELQPIKIGKRCNIQDCAVIHNLCTLGDDVSVGHGAIVHGATVGDRVIVGMGAIVLDGAKIGDDCIIAAGAVVTKLLGDIFQGHLVVLENEFNAMLNDIENIDDDSKRQKFIEAARKMLSRLQQYVV